MQRGSKHIQEYVNNLDFFFQSFQSVIHSNGNHLSDSLLNLPRPESCVS